VSGLTEKIVSLMAKALFTCLFFNSYTEAWGYNSRNTNFRSLKLQNPQIPSFFNYLSQINAISSIIKGNLSFRNDVLSFCFDDLSFHFDDLSFHFDDLSFRFDDLSFHFDDSSLRFDDLPFHFDDLSFHFDDLSFRFDDLPFRFDDLSFRFGDLSFHKYYFNSGMQKIKLCY
jgi:hypothetical protein